MEILSSNALSRREKVCIRQPRSGASPSKMNGATSSGDFHADARNAKSLSR